MAFAVAFVVVALMALWLPLVTGSSKPRLPFLTLAGILGGLAVSRNEWPGLPVGSWLSALPCYIALGGLLLGGLWFRYRDQLREPSFDEIGAKRIAKHIAWGVLQQALLLAFLVEDIGPWWAVGAFAVLHLPNPFLALLTLAGRSWFGLDLGLRAERLDRWTHARGGLGRR